MALDLAVFANGIVVYERAENTRSRAARLADFAVEGFCNSVYQMSQPTERVRSIVSDNPTKERRFATAADVVLSVAGGGCKPPFLGPQAAC
jgi:hypothetical protein